MTCSIEGCGSLVLCRGWCSKHYTRWQRHGDPLATSRQAPMPADADEKWCPRCERHRPFTVFRRRPASRGSSLHGYCRDCERTYAAARLARDPAKRATKRRAARAYSASDARFDLDLRRRYGITLLEYQAMLARQGGCCALCRATEVGGNGKRWHVDHDHSTGRVRGLLCMRCNLGLGYFRDDPATLVAALAYLGVRVPSGLAWFTPTSA